MDMSYLSASLRSLQSSVSMFTMSKSMSKDSQAMATLLADMEAAVPAPPAVLATRAGSMDIRV